MAGSVSELPRALGEKYARLEERVVALGPLGVALSGGVDSVLLARVAHDVLGAQATAITARHRTMTASDVAEAAAFCAELGMRHVIVDFDEFDVPGYVDNPPERCYLCKHALFERMLARCARLGLAHLADGSNASDGAGYRPGLKALAELGVVSPLNDVGIVKAEVRELARHLGLAAWNKPAAACLATRFPYGQRITEERLARVAAAERVLAELGFSQLRVRSHEAAGELARIEVPAEQIGLLVEGEVRERLVSSLRELGFDYVTLDLQGMRSGSMDEVLPARG